MPMKFRRYLQGVKTRKLNKAFPEVDALMSWRYAFGYFVCLSTFLLMTVVTLFFNLFYPQYYVLQWALNLVVLELLDLIVWTALIAGIQEINFMIAERMP